MKDPIIQAAPATIPGDLSRQPSILPNAKSTIFQDQLKIRIDQAQKQDNRQSSINSSRAEAGKQNERIAKHEKDERARLEQDRNARKHQTKDEADTNNKNEVKISKDNNAIDKDSYNKNSIDTKVSKLPERGNLEEKQAGSEKKQLVIDSEKNEIQIDIVASAAAQMQDKESTIFNKDQTKPSTKNKLLSDNTLLNNKTEKLLISSEEALEGLSSKEQDLLIESVKVTQGDLQKENVKKNSMSLPDANESDLKSKGQLKSKNEELLPNQVITSKWDIKDERIHKDSSDVNVSNLTLKKEETSGFMGSNADSSKDRNADKKTETLKNVKLEVVSTETTVPRNSLTVFDKLTDETSASDLRQKNKEIFDKLIQRAKVNIRRDGSSTASVRLNPKLLGSLILNIRLEQNVMQGNVIVENKSALKLIKDELEHLKQELKTQGIQVESLTIKVRESQSSGMDFHDARDENSLQNEFAAGTDSEQGQAADADANEPIMESPLYEPLGNDEYGGQLIIAESSNALNISA